MFCKTKYLWLVSKEPRSPRPSYVLHRVGQVVIEKQNGMMGVIVGWDVGLRAPPEWTKRKKYTDSEVQKHMISITKINVQTSLSKMTATEGHEKVKAECLFVCVVREGLGHSSLQNSVQWTGFFINTDWIYSTV